MNDNDILQEILHTLRQIRDRLPEPGQQPSPQQQPRFPTPSDNEAFAAFIDECRSRFPVPAETPDYGDGMPRCPYRDKTIKRMVCNGLLPDSNYADDEGRLLYSASSFISKEIALEGIVDGKWYELRRRLWPVVQEVFRLRSQQQPETTSRNPNNPARLQVLAILGESQLSAPTLPVEPDVEGNSPKRSV